MEKMDGISFLTHTLCTIQIWQNAHLFLAENRYLRYDILAACQSLSIFHLESFPGRKVLKKWPKAVRKSCLNCFSASGCFTITVEQRLRELTPRILHLSSAWVQWRIFFNTSGNTVLLNPTWCWLGWPLTHTVPGFFWGMRLHVNRNFSST